MYHYLVASSLAALSLAACSTLRLHAGTAACAQHARVKVKEEEEEEAAEEEEEEEDYTCLHANWRCEWGFENANSSATFGSQAAERSESGV